jgi:hypothetical protein
MKRTGERGAGNPHATFGRAGTGTGLTAMTTRARSWKQRIRPSQNLRSTASAPDPPGKGAIASRMTGWGCLFAKRASYLFHGVREQAFHHD